MKCPICKHGKTAPGTASVTLERGGAAFIFLGVPAEVCENCGEEFHSEEVTAALLKQAEAAIAAGVELGVRRFAAVA